LFQFRGDPGNNVKRKILVAGNPGQRDNAFFSAHPQQSAALTEASQCNCEDSDYKDMHALLPTCALPIEVADNATFGPATHVTGLICSLSASSFKALLLPPGYPRDGGRAELLLFELPAPRSELLEVR
jgi:hypothetical protein